VQAHPTFFNCGLKCFGHQALWAVCGRTAGVFSMEGASKHSVQLDVMPLLCGFLPLPAVRLSRYIPAEVKTKGVVSSFYLRSFLFPWNGQG